MNKEFQYKGFWHLPENPQLRVAGTLFFVPGKTCRLELIGSLQNTEEHWGAFLDEDNKIVRAIHGENSDAKKITLLSCRRDGSYNFYSSFPLINFNVDFIIEGIHLNDIDDMEFYSVQTSFPLLDQWVNHYKVRQSLTFNAENEIEQVNHSFSYAKEDVISHLINQNIRIDLKFHCEFSSEIRATRTLKQVTYCEFNYTNNVGLNELLNKINRFRALISLATFSHFYFDFIQLYSKSLYQELESGKRIETPIKVYYLELQLSELKQTKFRNFLFNYQEINQSFPTIIKKWFQASNDFSPIRQHLIESIIPKNIFKSGDFLIVAQALEGFHRRFRNKNEVFLKIRLKELLHEFHSVSIFKTFKIDCDQAVRSRNYYSHFFQKTSNVLTGKDLYELTRSLRVLLICCVLKEMGIDLNKIDELMDVNKFR